MEIYMRQKTWDLKQLPDAVKAASCWADVCRYLGRPPGGTSQATIIRWVKKLNLDTSHFDPKIGGRRSMKIRETPSEKMFTDNSLYPRSYIRKRLLRDSIIEYKCDRCHNNGVWMGDKLSLQVEHKNGISNDHRLENLCWLCPNCHSQTPTYSGKNRVRVVL